MHGHNDLVFGCRCPRLIDIRAGMAKLHPPPWHLSDHWTIVLHQSICHYHPPGCPISAASFPKAHKEVMRSPSMAPSIPWLCPNIFETNMQMGSKKAGMWNLNCLCEIIEEILGEKTGREVRLLRVMMCGDVNLFHLVEWKPRYGSFTVVLVKSYHPGATGPTPFSHCSHAQCL